MNLLKSSKKLLLLIPGKYSPHWALVVAIVTFVLAEFFWFEVGPIAAKVQYRVSFILIVIWAIAWRRSEKK